MKLLPEFFNVTISLRGMVFARAVGLPNRDRGLVLAGNHARNHSAGLKFHRVTLVLRLHVTIRIKDVEQNRFLPRSRIAFRSAPMLSPTFAS